MLNPVVLTLLLIAADDAKEEAKKLVNRGNQAFALEDYQTALENFEQAYAAYPSRKILVNLGETHRELGNFVKAVSYFEQFLSEAKSDDPALQQVQARIEEMEPKIGRIVIEAENVEVSIDGEAVEGTRFVVSPGEHRVEVKREGHHDFVRSISVGAGSTERIEVALEQLPSEPPPPQIVAETSVEEDEPITAKWWFWAGAGAVAVAVVGLVVGIAVNTGGDDFVPAGELPRARTSEWETF